MSRTILKLQSRYSHAKAKHPRVVLDLIVKFAMRHGAIRHNPLAGPSPLRRPPAPPKALTIDEIARIRAAATAWRTAPGLPGPKADGQLHDLIEVMLGSSARIGEALARRRCDVDMTLSPATVHICGTVGPDRRHSAFRRRGRPAPTGALPDGEPDHLLFFTKSGKPVSHDNARRTFRQVLEEAGLAGRGIAPHSFRKTVATLISEETDVELAAETLSHSGAAVARTHYIERKRRPNPETARILEQLGPDEED